MKEKLDRKNRMHIAVTRRHIEGEDILIKLEVKSNRKFKFSLIIFVILWIVERLRLEIVCMSNLTTP